MERRLRLLRQCLIIGGYCALLLFTSCQGASRTPRLSPPKAFQQTSKRVGPGIYHEVKSGQTLWGIARAYGVSVPTLAQANQLANTSSVYAGQKLHIPGATQLREVSSRCPCGPEVSSTPPSLPPTFSRPPERTAAARFTSSQSSHARETIPESVPFTWPVKGEVSRTFEQDATRRHDGIDIVAQEGTPIYAAADGEVIFSGWGPGGYGRTIILQHHADLVTIYAHNRENSVQVGQRIRQGEPIATVGQSGRATGNHLHFEVRYKATPVSPYKFLPRRPGSVVAFERG